jgi:uncharacterized membrane protein YfcA
MALSEPAVAVMLASAVGVIAGALALRQWYERHTREPGLSDADSHHYARQDFRRGVAGAVMVLLALGIAVGAQLGHKVAGEANSWFLEVWFIVFVLVLVLLGLAMADWIATRRYARRQHRAMAREQFQLLKLISALRRRSAYRGNGQDSPPNRRDDASPA